MTNFFALVKALEQGSSVRMTRWESTTRMFIKDGEMVCQRGDGPLYDPQLSWREMRAKKWSVV
jgi:hypothetical protein